MPMPSTHLDIAIVMQRTPLANRWATERWEPVAVEVEPRDEGGAQIRFSQVDPNRWRFSGYTLELHRSEAEGYHLNLTAPAPMVFVLWRMADPDTTVEGGPAARPELATVSYHEAARMLDGGEQVDGVPLPPAIRAWMEPFVTEHYKPEPKRKVRRRDPLRDEAHTGLVAESSPAVSGTRRE